MAMAMVQDRTRLQYSTQYSALYNDCLCGDTLCQAQLSCYLALTQNKDSYSDRRTNVNH